MRKEMTVADKLQRTFNNLPQEKKDRINKILENYEEAIFATPHEPRNEEKLVQEITTLREQVEKLKAELKSIDGALDDPRANLTLTTSEIIWELKEQVEKLTKERDDLRSRRCEVCGYLEHEREHTGCLREQLAALAEQNEKMRKALTKWRYLDSSYNWRCGHCGNEEGDEHKEGCALSLPDLASPVLNRIRAEGMRMAGDFVESPIGRKLESLNDGPRQLAEGIRARADELEQSNG